MAITPYLEGHWSLLVSLACPPPPPLLLFALNLPCSPEAAADALSGMLHSDLLLLLRKAWGEEGEIQTGGGAGNRGYGMSKAASCVTRCPVAVLTCPLARS
jgi:hypothetical protein